MPPMAGTTHRPQSSRHAEINMTEKADYDQSELHEMQEPFVTTRRLAPQKVSLLYCQSINLPKSYNSDTIPDLVLG